MQLFIECVYITLTCRDSNSVLSKYGHSERSEESSFKIHGFFASLRMTQLLTTLQQSE
ncbi:MAG: hypothetical protein KGZ71_10815 [Desulfobulbaceae bacterium]|nr:hypothetical protein [Desulfobulbaceae bacterium]